MNTRPHILVNVAMSADGKIDSASRKGTAISSPEDKDRVDRLRASVDAILVGGRTLLNEDPRLTVKSAELRAERVRKGWSENPAKVGVVSDISLEVAGLVPHTQEKPTQNSPLPNFMTSGPAQVYLFTTRCTAPEVLKTFERAGASVRTFGEQRVDLEAVFRSLHEEGIRSVLVEGGGTLIAELFRLDLVDELTIYIAPRILGGTSAPTLADGPGFLPEKAPNLELVAVEEIDSVGGILAHYTVTHKE